MVIGPCKVISTAGQNLFRTSNLIGSRWSEALLFQSWGSLLVLFGLGAMYCFLNQSCEPFLELPAHPISRQSWILDSRLWIPDSRYSIQGSLSWISTIPDPQTKVCQIPESGFPYMERMVLFSNFRRFVGNDVKGKQVANESRATCPSRSDHKKNVKTWRALVNYNPWTWLV